MLGVLACVLVTACLSPEHCDVWIAPVCHEPPTSFAANVYDNQGLLAVSSVSSDVSQRKTLIPVGEKERPENALALPDLLRCLVLTWSLERGELLRSAAENELWKVTVRLDADEFVRDLFRLQFPLVFADLPVAKVTAYSLMRLAVGRAAGVGSSQIVVCGQQGECAEEVWARSLGVWAYLPGDSGLHGLEHIFSEARKAIANQATKYFEPDAYR